MSGVATRRRGGWVVVGLLVAVGLLAVTGVALALQAGFSLDTDDPGDPGPGTDTEQLAVAVTPTDGLDDGTPVTLSSRAFRPNGIVGVTVCLEEALTDRRGVAACDTDGGQRFATTADGELDVEVPVPRVVTVDGTAHDCAERPGRCLLVAADSEDFDRSGGEPLTFASDLGPVDLEPAGPRPRTTRLPGSVSPTGPLEAGATATVTASGFVPGEPVLVAQCSEHFLRLDAWEACVVAEDDLSAAFSVVAGRSVDKVELHADPDGRVEAEIVVRDAVRPIVGEGGGASSCAEPDACALVVAAAADTQRSAYLPVTVG